MIKTCFLGSVFIVVLVSSSTFCQEDAEKDYDTAMTLGDYQLEIGEYESAITNFRHALAIRPASKPALASLGIAYSRSGDIQNALEILQQSLAGDPTDERIKYELAIVLFKLGDLAGAKVRFIAVSRGPADETLKAASRDYVDIIAAGTEEGKKKYFLDVLGGVQFDSNVILDPDNPVGPGRKQADWRYLTTVNGMYRFYEAKKTTAEARYFFYQSLHNTLKDFDLQQHDISASGHYYPTHRARYDLRYGFASTLVGEEKYSIVHRVTSEAVFNFSKKSTTELFYIYEKKKYYNSRLYEWNTDRDGSNKAAGVSHTIVFNKKSRTTAGYVWNRDSANTDFWQYRGNKGYVNWQEQLSSVKVSLSASYHDRKYDGILSQHASTQEYSLSLSRNLAKNVNMELSNLYILNDSSLTYYKYTRNIVSLFAVIWL